MHTPTNLQFNGQTYVLADQTEATRNLVASLQFVEAELAQLQRQTAVFQTARMTYTNALAKALETPAPEPDTTVNI